MRRRVAIELFAAVAAATSDSRLRARPNRLMRLRGPMRDAGNREAALISIELRPV